MNRLVKWNLYTLIFFSVLFVYAPAINAQTVTSIHVGKQDHYFKDQSGHPFFWMGDTEWELFHQLSVADAKKLLLERKKQGFTVVQSMSIGVFPEWGIMKKLERDTSNEAWIENDPSRINEKYFRRMDSIISYAGSIHMIMIVGVYHAQDVDHNRITKSNARTWARWIGKRYRTSSNVIWSMYPHAEPASQEILHEVISGLQESDGGNHMITIHPDPSPKSSSFFYPAPWLSFNTLQTWNSGYVNYTMVLEDYMRSPILPVVNGEARYEEEDGTTAMDTRRAGYFSMLAGGFYSFGHQDNWRSVATWRNWYASPGAKQMQIMSNLFKKISWWNLIPDSAILQNNTKENVAARSANGDWMIIYLSIPEQITINPKYLSLIAKSKSFWIDPETGKRVKAVFKENLSTPPAWKDAVLLVYNAKK